MRWLKYSFLIIWCVLFGVACKSKKTVVEPVPVVYKDSVATNFFRRTTGIIAGDVGFTIPLSNNKVLWLFGDSYLNNYNAADGTIPCLFQVNNAGLIHNLNDFSTNAGTTIIGNSAGIPSLFKLFQDATLKKLWPGNGYQLGDTIYIYNQGIKITGQSGGFDFVLTNEDYIAKIYEPTMQVVNYAPLPNLDSVFYGASFIKDDVAGYVYAYGTKNDGLGSKVYLARFRPQQPTSNWEFYTDNGWSFSQANKKVIVNGYSNSVHISKVGNRFVFLSSYFSVGCNQGAEIHSKIATQPFGPFENDVKLFTHDDKVQGNLPFNYFPIAHPESINNKNELLVTYSINGYEPCLPTCVNGRMNPDYYRLKAIRVPLSIIGSGF
jgi:hypothetical protein